MIVNGVSLDHELSSDFQSIVTQSNDDIAKQYPQDSFQQIFWDQHYEALTKKNPHQIQWHSAMIKWCLSLKLQSSSCYNTLRPSGVIQMPSDRTLRDYVNWAKPTTGFSTSVDNQLLAEAVIGSSLTPSHHQYVCLVFDECKIKEDLIYNKHSGELIGYTDVSGINLNAGE